MLIRINKNMRQYCQSIIENGEIVKYSSLKKCILQQSLPYESTNPIFSPPAMPVTRWENSVSYFAIDFRIKKKRKEKQQSLFGQLRQR